MSGRIAAPFAGPAGHDAASRPAADAGLRILHGRDDLPPRPRDLRLGALDAALDGVWLRWVRAEEVEVLRAIYGAVRDPAWNTVEPVVHDVVVTEARACLRVDFLADCRSEGIDFAWRGRVDIAAPGSVTFEMDGVARADSLVGRIGICVLHPAAIAGVDLAVETSHGPLASRFPDRIEPSRWLTDVVGLRWPAGSGLEASLSLEGDLFEVEDQRNWTDASFKTFSRPLRLPWPYRVAASERVHQVARLEIREVRRTGRRGAGRAPARTGPAVSIGPVAGPMPDLGVDHPRDGTAFTGPEREAIRALGPAHLRAVLDLGASGWQERLGRAADDALAVGAALEIEALGEAAAPWPDLAAAVAGRRPPVARLLVFGRAANDTPSSSLEAARSAFAGSGVPIGGGSRENFAELNRTAQPLVDLDVVAYPICAQCHASDEASIVETLEGQAATARQAVDMAAGRPVVVGPLLLRPLGVAAGPDAYRPLAADPRQASLFVAGWLAGSLDVLAAARVSAVTCFEGVGKGGLLDRSDARAGHWIAPGALFPTFHVVRALRGGTRRRAVVTGPGPLAAVAVQHGSALTVLVANLTFEPCTVTLDLPHLEARRIAILDEDTAPTAAQDPGWLEAASRRLAGPAREAVLALPRMAIGAVTGRLR